MKPKITPLVFLNKKSFEGINGTSLNMANIPVEKDKIYEQLLINLKPGYIGGNHQHQRIEWFVAFGDLVLFWMDKENKVFSQHMNPDGKLLLFEIPSLLPHAIENTSNIHDATLLEIADDEMKDVQKIMVRKNNTT